ncbi:MAG: magnesium/cobalt transporter CorA [Deltaproteobacteria bacterium]|nr:magnesium/cobalt transporter CorA [Deltaproteobacteria bacterium]
MARKPRRVHPGAPPGAMQPRSGAPGSVIQAICYDADSISERKIEAREALPGLLDERRVVWIHVQGLDDEGLLQYIGEIFRVHPLALADVMHTAQRPKVEAYADQCFAILRMPADAGTLGTEQLALVVGQGFVLSFQDQGGDCLEPVRDRLRKSIGRMRDRGAGYLAYAIADTVIDHYFPWLEDFGERLEAFEDEIVARPDADTVARIQDVRHDILRLHRTVVSLREAVNGLLKEPLAVFTDETRLFLRDTYDHSIRALEMVDTYRELSSGLMDLYLSTVGQRTNEVMKVLTIIATLFIPLSFIAGLYGMNFDYRVSGWNMPELRWAYGYLFALGLMAATATGLLLFFRSKGWLGRAERRRPHQAPRCVSTRPSTLTRK